MIEYMRFDRIKRPFKSRGQMRNGLGKLSGHDNKNILFNYKDGLENPPSVVYTILERNVHNKAYDLMNKSAALIFLTVLAVGRPDAATILGMDIDQVAGDAELIFEGRVIRHQTGEDADTKIISTYVTFSVLDVLKGDLNADSIELKFTGGTFNGRRVAVGGLIIPKTGEQGIYFVESARRNLLNPLLGWSQGHFLIIETGGERRISTVDDRPVTRIQSPSSISPAIKRSQRLIEGNGEVAAGVMTDTSPVTMDSALTVEEFKTSILNIIAEN